MEALNERIKNLRKEKGLTQGQLAEMLGITDKAVSKWEVGEANPDIALLPKMAEVFGVTLDYLLIGKKEEPSISLDDMDANKRAVYLAERDDAVQFGKYVKITESMLWSPDIARRSGRHMGEVKEEAVRKAVFEHHSIKVFALLLDAFLTHKDSRYINGVTVPGLVGDRIDEYVLMCAELGRIDALEDLGIKWFSIGGGKRNTRGFEDYVMKRETLESLFDEKRFPRSVIEYLADFPTFKHIPSCSVADYDRDIVNAYLETFLDVAYIHKDFTLLKGIMEKLNRNADEAITRYSERTSWPHYRYVEPALQADGRGYSGSDWGINAYVPMIHSALSSAKAALDRVWVTAFNEYNKKIEIGFDVKAPTHMTEAEIERYFQLHDQTMSESAKRDLTCVCNRIIQLNPLLATKDLKYIRATLDSYYWCFYEYAFDAMVHGNNKKEFFKLLVDNGFDDLAADLMKGLTEDFLKRAWIAFEIRPGDEAYDKHKGFLSAQNRVGIETPSRNPRTGVSEQNPERVAFSRANGRMEIYQIAKIIEGNPILARIKDLKDKAYQSVVDYFEKIKRDAEEKAERAKLAKGLTKSYFEGLIAKGDQDSIDLFSMKLCALMDAIFIYDYHYPGEDFSKRMDAHFKPIEDALPQKREMDDGWGYMVEDEKYTEEVVVPAREKFERLRGLFYRLRVTRNNLLHPEKVKVKELTKDELLECLSYVFSINKNPEE